MIIETALIGMMIFGGVIGFFIGYLCGIIHEDKINNEVCKVCYQQRYQEKIEEERIGKNG